jgi:hypothetical protein
MRGGRYAGKCNAARCRLGPRPVRGAPTQPEPRWSGVDAHIYIYMYEGNGAGLTCTSGTVLKARAASQAAPCKAPGSQASGRSHVLLKGTSNDIVCWKIFRRAVGPTAEVRTTPPRRGAARGGRRTRRASGIGSARTGGRCELITTRPSGIDIKSKVHCGSRAAQCTSRWDPPAKPTAGSPHRRVH